MEITYLDNSFKIKGKNASIVAGIGITIDNTTTNFKKEIDGPGEYEVAGISVIGIRCGKNTVYVIEAEGLRLLYLGILDQKLDESSIKEIGSIDIAFVPVEMDSIKQINASIIVPIYSKNEKEKVEAFVTEFGLRVENLAKLNIKEGDITSDEQHIVVLEKK